MISILLPVHGPGTFLSKTLDSIPRKLGPDYELIVILDRASLDAQDLIRKWSSARAEVVVVTSPRPGISCALNLGIATSKGYLIARLDDDDILIGNRLQLQKKYLDAHPKAVAVGSQVEFIDENGLSIGQSKLPVFQWQISLELELWNPLAHPAMMYRKEDLMACGGYNENLTYAQDFDLARRLRRQGGIANLSSVGLLYRIHHGQASRDKLNTRVKIISDLITAESGGRIHSNQSMSLASLTSNSASKFKFLLAIALFSRFRPLIGIGLVISKIVGIMTFGLLRFRTASRRCI
jgi:glycosyltransferase involved in cell wall biosynthesis